MIKTCIDEKYELDDIKYQTVVCKPCLLRLSAHFKDPSNPDRGRVLKIPSYENMTPPLFYKTRLNEDEPCGCTVCQIAKENLTPGRGQAVLPEKFWKQIFPDIPYLTFKVNNRLTKTYFYHMKY